MRYYSFKHYNSDPDVYNSIHSKYEGYMGFFCPHCYKTFIVKSNASVDINHTNKNNKTEIVMYPIFSINCANCGWNFRIMEWLDPNITPIIALLNKKGYITKFSCEGHVEYFYNEQLQEYYKSYSRGYIYFQNPVQKNVLREHPLPEPWYLDESPEIVEADPDTKEIVQITVNLRELFVIRCKPEYDYKSIKSRLEPLMKWAESLPVDYSWIDTNIW